LVFSEVAAKAEFAHDQEGRYIIDTVYGLRLKADSPLSLDALTALLNSSMLTFFLQQTGTVLRGSYFRIKTAYLNPFPIPRAFAAIGSHDAHYVAEQPTKITGEPDEVIHLVEELLAEEPEASADVYSVLDQLGAERQYLTMQYAARQAQILQTASHELEAAFLAWLEQQLHIAPDRQGDTDLDSLTQKNKLYSGIKNASFADIEEFLFQNKARLGVSLVHTDFSRALQREFNELVRKLQPIRQKIARTDDLIDQVVYRLYGLSAEEIAVVEGGRQIRSAETAALAGRSTSSIRAGVERVALAQTTDAELIRAVLQELERGATKLADLTARVAGRNPIRSTSRSLVEDLVRELRAVDWAEASAEHLNLGTDVPVGLLKPTSSAEELHLELAVAHERRNGGVVSGLLNRLRALAPHRQGAMVLPEPELDPPADRDQLADYARRQVAEWAGKLRSEYPATAAYLDDQQLGSKLATQFVELAALPTAAQRANRATELLRDAFAGALFGGIAAPRELIYTWVPRLAQAGLLMWARQLFGVSGMAIFPVGKFRNPDDPVDEAGVWQPGTNYRRIAVAAGEVALQAYALHTPDDEAGLERFVQVLVREYQALRSQELQPYVSLLACRDRVCYRLRIGNPGFERLLALAVAHGAARRIAYSIAIESDQSWAERGSNALELPVMVDGPRYLLAIEERKR
jgi:hypothetical protein